MKGSLPILIRVVYGLTLESIGHSHVFLAERTSARSTLPFKRSQISRIPSAALDEGNKTIATAKIQTISPTTGNDHYGQEESGNSIA